MEYAKRRKPASAYIKICTSAPGRNDGQAYRKNNLLDSLSGQKIPRLDIEVGA